MRRICNYNIHITLLLLEPLVKTCDNENCIYEIISGYAHCKRTRKGEDETSSMPVGYGVITLGTYMYIISSDAPISKFVGTFLQCCISGENFLRSSDYATKIT